MSITIKLNLRN